MSWLSSAFHSVENAVGDVFHGAEHLAGDIFGGVESVVSTAEHVVGDAGSTLGGIESVLAGTNPLSVIENALLSGITGNGQDSSGFGSIGGALQDIVPFAESVFSIL